ncbi:hypothetical protein QTP86_031423 [Hemibagrus guttatus]|nr:hypothetical protein QTP86_031423 [Hemibagrus guttatus]
MSRPFNKKKDKSWMHTPEALAKHFIAYNAKTSFYKEKLETSAQDPRKLHNIFSSLLNPPAPPSPSSLTVEDFASFYTEKIERICQTFTSLPTSPTSHNQHSTTPSLTQLSTVAAEEVLQITRSCNPTTCPLDPIPSAMLQTISPDLLPFITTVINGSLTSGHVPTAFKKARVIPILKKPALDPSDISNYRLVSLLSFLSKILERVVCNQLSDYLMQNNLHDPNQSGFKAAHSTETALLAVTEKLHAARSAKLSSVLILLDLSAAFDTVNHKTLLSTLRSLGICGTAWEWFASYLDGRSYQFLGNTEVDQPKGTEVVRDAVRKLKFQRHIKKSEGQKIPKVELQISIYGVKILDPKTKVEPAETATPHLMALSNLTLTVEESEVRRTLRSINPRKATGPDGVPGRVLKDCADLLAEIFTKIFNQSLARSIVPPCLKSSIIVPLPKKSHISSLSDYRPGALTPVVMKCFEKLVRSHITSLLPPSLDSHQFAYKGNRSTEDAVATALHAAFSHLEKQGSYVQMLFVDYSSAFNTILPHILEMQHNCQLHRISFCADDKTDKRIFTFICKDSESNKHLCYVFDSEKCAEEITLTIGQAFDLAYKKFLESGGKDVETRKQIASLQKRIQELETENSELKQQLQTLEEQLLIAQVPPLLHINSTNEAYMLQRPSSLFWCHNLTSFSCLEISSVTLTPMSSPDSSVSAGVLTPPPSKPALPKPLPGAGLPRPRGGNNSKVPTDIFDMVPFSPVAPLVPLPASNSSPPPPPERPTEISHQDSPKKHFTTCRTVYDFACGRDLFGAEPFDPFICGGADFPPDVQSRLDEMQVTACL